MKNRPFLHRVGYALAGLSAAWHSEASFRQQLLAAAAALLALSLLQPPLVWWALIVLVIGMVLAAELLNTALERVIDRLHPEYHPMLKVAKDCAAGAVLTLSITAAWLFVLLLAALWWE